MLSLSEVVELEVEATSSSTLSSGFYRSESRWSACWLVGKAGIERPTGRVSRPAGSPFLFTISAEEPVRPSPGWTRRCADKGRLAGSPCLALSGGAQGLTAAPEANHRRQTQTPRPLSCIHSPKGNRGDTLGMNPSEAWPARQIWRCGWPTGRPAGFCSTRWASKPAISGSGSEPAVKARSGHARASSLGVRSRRRMR